MTGHMPGDLCVPSSDLASRVIIISQDDHLLDFLAEVGVSSMVMVTAVPEALAHHLHAMRRIIVAANLFHDPRNHRVLQIVVASGPHAGRVGYVPSFWLDVIHRP